MIKMPLKYMIRNKIKDIILSEKKKIKQARINDYEILVPVDEGIGWLIYYLKNYNKKETNFIRRMAKKDWICFDIGANVGYYSLLFASLCKKGETHSFEPLPLCYHLLSASISLNNFDNVRLNNFALSNYSGVSKFTVSKKCESSSFVHTEMSPLENIIQVKTMRLDDYIRENDIARIDFVKLDVEGAEKLVLEGSLETISRKELQPKILLVELYDPNFIHYNTSIDEIVKFLNSYGYEAFIILKQQLVPFTTKHYNNYYNVFFIKKEMKICKNYSDTK